MLFQESIYFPLYFESNLSFVGCEQEVRDNEAPTQRKNTIYSLNIHKYKNTNTKSTNTKMQAPTQRKKIYSLNIDKKKLYRNIVLLHGKKYIDI